MILLATQELEGSKLDDAALQGWGKEAGVPPVEIHGISRFALLSHNHESRPHHVTHHMILSVIFDDLFILRRPYSSQIRALYAIG